MTKIKNSGEQSVGIKLLLSKTSVEPGETTPIEVLLTNFTDSSLTINARFCMGYPDFKHRDLYCEILHENGETYQGYKDFEVDYRPEDLTNDLF